MALGAGCLRALCGAWVKSDPEVDNSRVTRSSERRIGCVGGQAFGRCCLQASAQVVPVWVRPIASRRRRFNAALR